MNNHHSYAEASQHPTHLHSILQAAKIIAMLLLLVVLLAFALLVKNTFDATFPGAKQTVDPDAPAEATPVVLPAITGDVVHLNVDRVMKVWREGRKQRMVRGIG